MLCHVDVFGTHDQTERAYEYVAAHFIF
jgi:hypothetical protein